MSSRSVQFAVVLLAFASAIVFVSGCGQSTSVPQAAAKAAPTTPAVTLNAKAINGKEEEHPHVPGSHGGIIIPIGSDSYHAEAVIEKDGSLRLLTLGADENRIQEVDVQPIRAYVKASGTSDATAIDLVATPQDGDALGKTSQFIGKLPEALVGQAIEVTIPNLRIASERFRIGFTTKDEEHDNGMPAAVMGVEEQKLYFTPGGKYTEADIKANGKLTAGTKFKGFMSKHDMKPKPGEKICPVTFTKANPKIEWQVDGKKYIFCCPPCVDEFVRMAKEEPDQLKAPEDYVQGELSSVADKESESQQKVADPEIAAALAELSDGDRALAESQKYCAVITDSLLGSMGPPVKVDVNGQAVFLCCDGCQGKALRKPDETLANVAKLKAKNAVTQ